ncbi:TrbM/KikA/MpfK family conjugal transfer protein [Massilia sp. DWR3-1-1]|uniref:TrbM/KikA/MpfK family conjugal transfer protein n=1 Tax=Massilia sp. DWR3-1-1 TaxID=2804559 RepID=UPI003CEA9F36
MKKIIASSIALIAACASWSAGAADNEYSGDTKLACEAILCLSTGSRPSECAPSIRRYFNITKRKPSDTLKARKNFLKMCPAATQDQNMSGLVDAITNGAGRCDTAALNSALMVWRDGADDGNGYTVSNRLPDYCSNYAGNVNTDLKPPVYLGSVERGGRWVDADSYSAELTAYEARIAAEDAARNAGTNQR